MENAYFFSDETGSHSGGRYFLVAGIALTKYRMWIADELHACEIKSGKGKQAWKGTKNIGHRVAYIEQALALENLCGAVFYAAYENNARDYWAYTVDAIRRAVERFGAGGHSIIRHQGFNGITRYKLKNALASTGYSFEIQAGSAEKRCEIRLADGLAGYLGLVKYNHDSETAGYFPAVPDWFVDLKNEAPARR